MSPPHEPPHLLLSRASAGDAEALGRLLELYRNYLKVLTRSMLSAALRLHADPSDIVQEVNLKASADFADFAGTTEPELMAWLRRILVRTLTDHARYHRARRRDHRRAESLEVLLDRSSIAAQEALAAPIASPSALAVRREHAVLLADALERLPADYREVFLLRNVEHIPFDQIAAKLGRSAGAARHLWTRAMLALRRELGGNDGPR